MFRVQLNSILTFILETTTAWKFLSYVMKISQANIYFVKVAVSVIVVKHDPIFPKQFYVVDLYNGCYVITQGMNFHAVVVFFMIVNYCV